MSFGSLSQAQIWVRGAYDPLIKIATTLATAGYQLPPLHEDPSTVEKKLFNLSQLVDYFDKGNDFFYPYDDTGLSDEVRKRDFKGKTQQQRQEIFAIKQCALRLLNTETIASLPTPPVDKLYNEDKWSLTPLEIWLRKHVEYAQKKGLEPKHVEYAQEQGLESKQLPVGATTQLSTHSQKKPTNWQWFFAILFITDIVTLAVEIAAFFWNIPFLSDFLNPLKETLKHWLLEPATIIFTTQATIAATAGFGSGSLLARIPVIGSAINFVSSRINQFIANYPLTNGWGFAAFVIFTVAMTFAAAACLISFPPGVPLITSLWLNIATREIKQVWIEEAHNHAPARCFTVTSKAPPPVSSATPRLLQENADNHAPAPGFTVASEAPRMPASPTTSQTLEERIADTKISLGLCWEEITDGLLPQAQQRLASVTLKLSTDPEQKSIMATDNIIEGRLDVTVEGFIDMINARLQRKLGGNLPVSHAEATQAEEAKLDSASATPAPGPPPSAPSVISGVPDNIWRTSSSPPSPSSALTQSHAGAFHQPLRPLLGSGPTSTQAVVVGLTASPSS